MAGKTGTLTLADLEAQTFVSAMQFGLDRIADAITNDLAVHNEIVRQLNTELIETTADAQRTSPASTASRMAEVNELGRARTQKAGLGATVAFPLRLFQYNIGWTRKWFENHTPAEMALQQNAAKKAHVLEIERQFKRSVYLSANYSFVDYLVKGVTLGVKRLLNADGFPIGDGPNGETYDGTTHTHYLANATLTAAAVTSLVNTVLEHNPSAAVRVAFAATDETAVRALTGFVAAIDPRLGLNTAANQPTQRLDIARLNNRFIGYFGPAEVWIKPWAIANYAFAWDAGAPGKVAALRERTAGAGDLRVVAEFEDHPIHTQFQEAEFGVGVWNRTAAAVLYFAGGAYSDPTIT